jgi:hypothetical protein
LLDFSLQLLIFDFFGGGGDGNFDRPGHFTFATAVGITSPSYSKQPLILGIPYFIVKTLLTPTFENQKRKSS